MKRTRLQTLVRYSLGLLLLAASGMKAYGWAVNPVSELGFFSSPVFSVLLIEFEFALGLWLICGGNSVTAWLAAVVSFGVFAAVNVYSGVEGQASCGCFGKLSLSPWLALAMDVTAV